MRVTARMDAVLLRAGPACHRRLPGREMPHEVMRGLVEAILTRDQMILSCKLMPEPPHLLSSSKIESGLGSPRGLTVTSTCSRWRDDISLARSAGMMIDSYSMRS